MWKKRFFIIGLMITLALPAAVSAQDSLIVWNVLSPDDSSALAQAGERVGMGVVLEEVDATLLLDVALTAEQGGSPEPDVIVTDQLTASNLFDYGMITSMGISEFFLPGLIDSLPDLLTERCQDVPLDRCLWPGASVVLPVQFPDDKVLEDLRGWVCQSAEALPHCSGSAEPGVPVSWGFTILLFNFDWLAQNGVDIPYNLDTALEVRGQWKMSIVEADRRFLPLAGELSPDEIYTVSSALLVEDPDGVMTSLASFYQAGYVPVLSLNIDSAYVGASAANPRAAFQYAQSLDDPAIKTDLFFSSQRLPAFYANDVWNAGVTSQEGEATLRALTLLVTYAALAY
ncbi:MAG: hypothetical protein HY866_00345 [Chloroflexi bacterium]|nr:hypothetical protein [Chloroflexota bacterium]